MSGQPWNRVLRTSGSVMEVDPSQPRSQVTLNLPPLPPPLTLNGDTVLRKRRRLLSPESSEETIDDRDRRDFERKHPTQDTRWEGPSHPPSVASGSGHNSPTTDDMHRLALTGPVAYGEYYEPDGDEPGFTQPAQDPPTPTQTEVPLDGDAQVVVRSSQPVFRKQLTKEDTLMSIDFSQSQDDSSSNDTALEEKLAAMFDLMRQKQRDDMELFVQSIRTCWRLECADLKNEMMKLRTEVVDLQLQYQRMQNLH